MPIKVGATREYRLPEIGVVKLRYISIGDVSEAEKYVATLPENERSKSFVNFLLGKLIVEPNGYDKVENIPFEAQKALVPVLVENLGVTDRVDLSDIDRAIPYADIYKAYNQKMKEFVEEVIFPLSRKVRVRLAEAVADSVIVSGDTRIVIPADGKPVVVRHESQRSLEGFGQVGKRRLSEQQAFDRLEGATRVFREQVIIDIEQARKEAGQIHTLMLLLIGLGVLLILVGVALLYLHQVTAGTISLASSLVTETIAGMFFRKDSELRERVSEYHEQLWTAQEVLRAMDIGETIENDAIRDEMKKQIIGKILEIDFPP